MYTYRKPKNIDEAFELIVLSGKRNCWSFYMPSNKESSAHFFEMYYPILFIYKHDDLYAAAHNKFGKVLVYDLSDKDITDKFNKKQLAEIDLFIRQIELF